MRIFEKGYKINFVDENDVLVGFDFQENCCEHFGYFITPTEPNKDNIRSLQDEFVDEDPSPEELNNFRFDTEYFHDYPDYDGGGYAVFRLRYCRLERDSSMRARERRVKLGESPPLFLVLFNHHNGYYSHGFDMTVGGTVIHDGGL